MREPLPNRCKDLFFDPAAPGSEADRATQAEHQTSCSPHASQEDRDASLIRLWEATRPVEPDEGAWETVWARVSDRLDRVGAPPETVPFSTAPAGHWRRLALSAFVVAQAAAILGGVVFLGGQGRPTGSSSSTAPSLAARTHRGVDVDIEPGEVVMIHLDGASFRAVALAHEEQRPDTLDENLVLFNDAEAMAGMQETIAEMHHHAHSEPPPG